MVLNASQELALDALNAYMKFVKIEDELDSKKQKLRELANGESLRIEVDNVGSVLVMTPKLRSTKKVLSINEEKLAKVPELRAMLISKGVITEETKVIPSAKAAVKISPMVVETFASPPE